MKLVLASLFFGLMSLNLSAAECSFQSVHSSLENPTDSKVICDAVLFELGKELEISESSELFIQANGYRRIFDVELSSIELFQNKTSAYKGSGNLHWNPDGERVDLY